MVNSGTPQPITIFDTTLRDGELKPGIQFSLDQKVAIAHCLDQLGVDVIEVGYPGIYEKDIDAIKTIAGQLKKSVICGLASAKLEEIDILALCLKSASQGRIHLYAPVRLTANTDEVAALEIIRDSIVHARHHSPDVEWSAFDATRSEPDFLCRAVEVAIAAGATTINIPDSLGVASPEEFSMLIASLQRVPNLEKATLSVHCHDDLGYALENSLIALNYGVRQIECSIAGLGARKGNAALKQVVQAIANHPNYTTRINPNQLDQATQRLSEMIGTKTV